MVTERQEEILNLIIDIFIKTHEPVGSKALQGSIASSSATIRNDMAELEKLGLLEKVHISSGRMPSVEGFKYFVEHSLTFDDLSEEDIYQIAVAFDHEFFNIEDILQTATDILSNMTQCTAIALDVEPSSRCLTAFDIVILSPHVALAISTLDESTTITSQFAIPKNFLTEDLLKLRDLVRERFLQETVLGIHYKIRTEIPQIIQRYFIITDNVLDLFEHIFKEMFVDKVQMAGKIRLLEYSSFSTYQFFDDFQQVALEIRDSIADSEMQSVRVADSKIDSLQNLTLITTKFLVPCRGFGLLTIVGPVNLDYKRMVSLHGMVNRVLMMKITDFYRYLSSNHYEVS